MHACLGVLCHLHFWQNDRGLFTCHCGNTGVERTPNESAHKVDSGEENSLAAPAGDRTRNLSIMGPAFLPTSYPGSNSIDKCKCISIQGNGKALKSCSFQESVAVCLLRHATLENFEILSLSLCGESLTFVLADAFDAPRPSSPPAVESFSQ